LYFNFFSDSFCITFLSDGIATSINKQILSFMFLIIMSGLFARTSLSVCTPWFHSSYIFMLEYWLRYVGVPLLLLSSPSSSPSSSSSLLLLLLWLLLLSWNY
jgi:hypothetical protein